MIINKSKLTEFTSEFEVTKVDKEYVYKTNIPIANEIPVTVTGNDIEICTLMCSPYNLKELTYGFLYNSGIINNISEILSFDYNEGQKQVKIDLTHTPDAERLKNQIVTIGGKGIKYVNYDNILSYSMLDFNFHIKKENICVATEWFQSGSNIYKVTNCVHSSALSVNGAIPEIIFEDVARHNSVDKTIGCALIKNIDFSKCMLFCSCRVSSEILNKAGRCGIPIVVSLKSPTHQAILLTQNMKLTLIGRVKEDSFIIYSNPERVLL